MVSIVEKYRNKELDIAKSDIELLKKYNFK